MKIEARGLRRSYRSFQRRPGLTGAVRDLFRLGGEERVALHGLDLDIEAGERVALIGPNGAGKSTTVKLCCGILAPTAGELRVGGLEPSRQRRAHVRNIGVVFGQRTQLWWDLAVQEAFALLGGIFEVPPALLERRLARFDEVLELAPLLGTPVRELSLGQRMRCDLAAALLHGPQILFLDEPTIGLDVAVKQRIRRFLAQLNEEEGTTILLTTHDLSDVEAVCERVLLINEGRLLFDGGVDALKASLGGERHLQLHLAAAPADPSGLGAALDLPATWMAPEVLRLTLPAAEAATGPAVRTVLARIEAAGLELVDLSVTEPDMDALVAHHYESRR